MITLSLPYPVSVNAIWRAYKGRQVLTQEARRYKNEVKYVCSQKKVKMITGPISIIVEVRPKMTISGRASKVLIDLDNSLKLVCDALQGIIIDNDRDIKRIYAYYGEPVQSGGLIITIEPYE